MNKSLKILSLDHCLIGDEGLAVICKEIQNSNNLNRINFSSCNLTHEGAAILATLIKVQALKRHNEAWKDSLRYGRPDLDSMFGIRRITINSNPQVKDAGVKALAEAFKSDLWLKALDLQDCGITTAGANELLDGLKFNAMMHVLDVRLNVEIERDTLQKIMEQVMINSSGNSTEYEWMELTKSTSSASMHKQPSTSTAIGTKLKKRRNTNASFSKKAQFNASGMKMKRCKSTGSVILNQSPEMSNFQAQHQKQSTSSGIPWRTAARANRYRVSSSCAYRKINGDEYDQNENEFDEYYDEENSDELIHEEDEEDMDDPALDHKRKATSDRNMYQNSNKYDENNLLPSQHLTTTIGSLKRNEKNEFMSNLDKIKNVSVKDLLIILQKEQETKTQLEDMLIQLQDENTKLKTQINTLKGKLEQASASSSNLKRNKSDTFNRTMLDDDKALEIIELTLQKYQNFLDFLRNAGFGKLIDMGEMNQQMLQQKQQQQPLINKFRGQMDMNEAKSKKQQSQGTKVSSDHLTDQEKYYLNKIKKTKHKLSRLNGQQFDESEMTMINPDETNQNIDALVSNALELSKTYRRFNNSTMINKFNGLNDETVQSNDFDDESILRHSDQMPKTSKNLISEFKSMKTTSTDNRSNNSSSSSSSRSNSNSLERKKQFLNLPNQDQQLKLISIEDLEEENYNEKDSSHRQQQSTASNSSPPTTVISNKINNLKLSDENLTGAANPNKPTVSVRTHVPSFNYQYRNPRLNRLNHEDEDDDDEDDENDKEIEDNNVSEALSEDSRFIYADEKHSTNTNQKQIFISNNNRISTDTANSQSTKQGVENNYKEDDF
jgi:hypothetical protein